MFTQMIKGDTVGLNGWRSVDYKFNVIFKSKFDNEDFA
jgi:hypothetical protein